MRPSPLNPGNPCEWGETPPSAIDQSRHRTLPRTRAQAYDIPSSDAGEASGEEQDQLSGLRKARVPGVFMGSGYSLDESPASSSRAKASRVLGPDPQAKLASFYMVSGLCKVCRSITHRIDTPGTISLVTRRHRCDPWYSAQRGLAQCVVAPRRSRMRL